MFIGFLNACGQQRNWPSGDQLSRRKSVLFVERSNGSSIRALSCQSRAVAPFSHTRTARSSPCVARYRSIGSQPTPFTIPRWPCSTASSWRAGSATATSHTRTELSSDTVASRHESGAHATSTTSPVCPRSVDTHRHFSTFGCWLAPNGTLLPKRSPAAASRHSITRLSSEPDARSRPSADHRAQFTAPKCPVSVASSRGTRASASCVGSRIGATLHSFTLPSCPAVATREPSGCTPTERSDWPSWETHSGLSTRISSYPSAPTRESAICAA